jgi:hypothetical protein
MLSVRILLEKLILAQLVKNFHSRLESKGSLPYLKEPAIESYPEPNNAGPHLHSLTYILIFYSHVRPGLPKTPFKFTDESNPCSKSSFPKTHFNIFLEPTPRSSDYSLSSGFPNHNLLCISHLFRHVTCPTNLMLLDLIALLISEEYKLWHFTVLSVIRLKTKCSVNCIRILVTMQLAARKAFGLG